MTSVWCDLAGAALDVFAQVEQAGANALRVTSGDRSILRQYPCSHPYGVMIAASAGLRLDPDATVINVFGVRVEQDVVTREPAFIVTLEAAS